MVLGDSYDLNTHSWNPDGIRVIRQQDFWFVFFMTILCVHSPLSTARRSLSVPDIRSILIPWFTVREVTVDIEVVSPFRQRESSAFMECASSSAAIPEGGNLALRARHAAGPPYADISVFDHGVPRLWHRFVSHGSRGLPSWRH